MDPLNPWLDPIETRRLAERLMMPLRDPAVVVPDPGFDPAFVGFEAMQPVIEPATAPAWPAAQIAPPPAPELIAAEPEVITPPPAQPVQPEPSEEPPPLPFQAAPPSETSPPTAARGPFLDRIHRLCAWMHKHFSATDIFILDREGAVIFDQSDHGRLHFMARSLALASRRPGAPAENVHVKIGANATLEVIPVNTPFGWLVLGTIVPDTLPTQSVEAIKSAMLQVASPRSTDRQ